MRIFLIIKKLKKINAVLLGLSLLIAVAIIYFLYNRENTRQYIYATMLVGPYPYWQESAVKKDDRDITSFGQENGRIIDKESFEAGGNGKSSVLLVKINVIKDRAGIYLYKNKPIAIGSNIDLRLPLVDVWGMILRVDKKIPEIKEKKLTVHFKNKGYEPEQLGNIKIGDEMVSSKGRVLAKITGFKISPQEVRSDTSSGQALISYDYTKRDLEVSAEILVNIYNNENYFMNTKKVKKGENLDLLFKDYNLWQLTIVTVEEKVN